jgi:hypothetical protein
MRWIGTSLLVATLGITCLAQVSQPASAGDNSGLRIAENPKIELKNNLALTPRTEDNSKVPLDLRPQPGYSAYTVKRPGEPDMIVWVPDVPTVGCYSLRVYHFERDDTEAPEMTGETTCTEMSKRAFKRVMPEARLVPAN